MSMHQKDFMVSFSEDRAFEIVNSVFPLPGWKTIKASKEGMLIRELDKEQNYAVHLKIHFKPHEDGTSIVVEGFDMGIGSEYKEHARRHVDEVVSLIKSKINV